MHQRRTGIRAVRHIPVTKFSLSTGGTELRVVVFKLMSQVSANHIQTFEFTLTGIQESQV